MKKIVIISITTAVLDILLYGFLEYMRFPGNFLVLLLAVILGILLVLTQKKEKSYEFLPKLIFGSFLSSLFFCSSLLLIAYSRPDQGVNYSILEMASSMTPFFIFLFCLTFFGGLIGIVIRGITLLIKNYAHNK